MRIYMSPFDCERVLVPFGMNALRNKSTDRMLDLCVCVCALVCERDREIGGKIDDLFCTSFTFSQEMKWNEMKWKNGKWANDVCMKYVRARKT